MVGRAPRARRNTTNNQKGKTKMIVKFITMKGVISIAASLFHNLRVQSVSWCPLSTFEQFSNFESDCIMPYGATRCDTPLSVCCFAALSNHPFRPFRLYAEAPRRVCPLSSLPMQRTGRPLSQCAAAWKAAVPVSACARSFRKAESPSICRGFVCFLLVARGGLEPSTSRL